VIRYLAFCILGAATLLVAGVEGWVPRLVAVLILTTAGIVLGTALEARYPSTTERTESDA
jgi:hypothetical protein